MECGGVVQQGDHGAIARQAGDPRHEGVYGGLNLTIDEAARAAILVVLAIS
jgi:hypothetical protein